LSQAASNQKNALAFTEPTLVSSNAASRFTHVGDHWIFGFPVD
jgi:hypothetical protein